MEGEGTEEASFPHVFTCLKSLFLDSNEPLHLLHVKDDMPGGMMLECWYDAAGDGKYMFNFEFSFRVLRGPLKSVSDCIFFIHHRGKLLALLAHALAGALAAHS